MRVERRMNFSEAQGLAYELMERHGLLRQGWLFRWSGGKRQLGCAQVVKKRSPLTGKTIEKKYIKLSRHLVRLNSDDEVRETILHEIAHAIAGVKNGHNHVWKAACIRVGAKPVRLAGEEVKVVAGRFTLLCLGCKQALGTRHRRVAPKRLKTSYCKRCGPAATGMLRVVETPPSQ
jgi:predicted SprT family Zn-dependent metalloprotease